MSFMYMINRRGPKMEPCGTPTVMSFFVDCVLFISTLLFPISQITLHQFQSSFT